MRGADSAGGGDSNGNSNSNSGIGGPREVTIIASQQPWFMTERILGATVYRALKLLGIASSPAQSRVSQYIYSRGDGILRTEAQRAIRAGRMRLRTGRVVDAHARSATMEP